MIVGEMKNRVDVQIYEVTVNEFGDTVKTWISKGERWAKIEPISAREYFNAQAVQALISHRIVWRNRYFNVSSIRNLNENNIEYEIFSNEVISDE